MHKSPGYILHESVTNFPVQEWQISNALEVDREKKPEKECNVTTTLHNLQGHKKSCLIQQKKGHADFPSHCTVKVALHSTARFANSHMVHNTSVIISVVSSAPGT